MVKTLRELMGGIIDRLEQLEAMFGSSVDDEDEDQDQDEELED